MKKRLQLVMLLSLCLTVSPVFAGIYAQYIHMKVKSYPLALSSITNDVCFTTTDWLDKGYCGNNTSNIYRFGPKNVRMVAKGALRDARIDASCEEFFFSTVRTPEFSGEVKLSVSIAQQGQAYVIHSCSIS